MSNTKINEFITINISIINVNALWNTIFWINILILLSDGNIKREFWAYFISSELKTEVFVVFDNSEELNFVWVWLLSVFFSIDCFWVFFDIVSDNKSFLIWENGFIVDDKSI